jgi:hypothetical protein
VRAREKEEEDAIVENGEGRGLFYKHTPRVWQISPQDAPTLTRQAVRAAEPALPYRAGHRYANNSLYYLITRIVQLFA